ncbi:MAG: hypothetical protein QW589_02855 [Candidatus Bathyarchaeia archaeon]
MSHKAKYVRLLESDELNLWYRNLARGSKITADVYLRRLGFFCKKHGITPEELARLSDENATRLLLKAINELEDKGYTGGYIESIFKAIKSWLRHNGVNLKAKIKIKGYAYFSQ